MTISKDMPDDHGKARAETVKALSGARVGAIVTEAKKDGLSPGQIGEKIFANGFPEETIRSMIFIAFCMELLRRPDDAITGPAEEVAALPCMDGYAYAMRGLIDHPIATQWVKRLMAIKTVDELFTWFLEDNMDAYEFFAQRLDIDEKFFLETIATLPYNEVTPIPKNRATYAQEVRKLAELVARELKEFEEAEELHQKLMKD